MPCPGLPCPTLRPALPCPGMPYPALPCHALPCPAPSCPCPALSFPALPGPALPCPALPCPALPCPALPCPALSCPALPCPALPWPSVPCPALPPPLSGSSPGQTALSYPFLPCPSPAPASAPASAPAPPFPALHCTPLPCRRPCLGRLSNRRSHLAPSSTHASTGTDLSCVPSQVCLTLPCPDSFCPYLAVGQPYFALSSPLPRCLLFRMHDPTLCCCALPESYLASPALPSGASQHPSSTARTESAQPSSS